MYISKYIVEKYIVKCLKCFNGSKNKGKIKFVNNSN